MPTTRLVHLQNSCAILRNRRFTLPVPFLMVVERHPFMRQCFRGKKFVYCHCRNHLVNPHSENHCLQLSMFNLIIVLKITNVNTCFVFCHCLWQKIYSNKYLYLSWWWGTYTMTLMRHSDVGAWSCMKRIFSLYRFSWNHTWIWIMCPWSRTWLRKYQISRPSSSHTCWRERTVWWDIQKYNNYASIWGLMVSPPCSSNLCAHLLIGIQRMIYSCGVITMMGNVCSWMGIQSLTNPISWSEFIAYWTVDRVLGLHSLGLDDTWWRHAYHFDTRILATKSFDGCQVRRHVLRQWRHLGRVRNERALRWFCAQSAGIVIPCGCCLPWKLYGSRTSRRWEHPNPIWLVKTLSSPNFVRTSPNFCQIEVEYCRRSTKD